MIVMQEPNGSGGMADIVPQSINDAKNNDVYYDEVSTPLTVTAYRLDPFYAILRLRLVTSVVTNGRCKF
jgi:hypothetical protein